MSNELRTTWQRARERAGEEAWLRYSAHEQTMAVYSELRTLDNQQYSPMGEPTSARPVVSKETTTPVVVRLRLIGQMQAWTIFDDNVLPTGRKTRALLAAVALAAPRPASRARLAELLWSRRPEEQARASLRQEIQLLLKALAPAKTEILRVSRDQLSLAADVTWIDVDQINRPGTEQAAALTLLDGDLLEDLDGIDPAFDIWLAGERERLRDHARGMAETILHEQDTPETIVQAAQRLLQIDRTHEEAWRALMRAHADRGERGMAIQAYDRCRGVLAELLDAAPSPETQTLLTQIRGPSSKHLPSRPPRPVEPPATRDAAASLVPSRGARIAVLPMRCVGLPEDLAHLGPSLANDITAALSRFRWMSVISLNCVARQARERGEAPVARYADSTDFLLDGAIQRSRGRVRITLRLLDLRADNQVVWARRFDRTSDDPLAMQEEVAGQVAAQIDPVMLLIQAKRHSGRALTNPTAYQLVLGSAPQITRLEKPGFLRAGEQLARAIELEPEHASAHAWYAAWHCLLVSQGWADDPAAVASTAVALAERAIALDPWSAAVFTIAGHLRAVLDHNPREAAALHERALELNPNLAAAWALSAITHVLLGDIAEAERRHARYKALSPLDPYAALFDALYGVVHLLKRDHAGAELAGRAATQLSPAYAAGYKLHLAALGHLGKVSEAAAVLRRLQAIEPGVTVERCLATMPLLRAGDRDHYAEGLNRAGMAWQGQRQLRRA